MELLFRCWHNDDGIPWYGADWNWTKWYMHPFAIELRHATMLEF
jgi:hypothetical protein